VASNGSAARVFDFGQRYKKKGPVGPFGFSGKKNRPKDFSPGRQHFKSIHKECLDTF
jgi:hypothetical protein